jgi:predicted dehydrogenase
VQPLKLGVIGSSEGNGHPFSWSAICNGYEPSWMDRSGYPGISAYLAKQEFPRDQLQGARVTHVWTQDPALTAVVARAALIPEVVASPEEMIGKVDAVLLARDDAQNHRRLAAPFIAAGLPIYIDKPLALSLHDARAILDLQSKPAQVFTCSALRYAKELSVGEVELAQLGRLQAIDASAPKDWDRYSVHAIEPMLRFVDAHDRVDQWSSTRAGRVQSLSARYSSGLTVRVTCFGVPTAPIRISLYGTTGCLHLEFGNAFAAFKAALEAFVVSVRESKVQIAREEVLRVIEFIERGRSDG